MVFVKASIENPIPLAALWRETHVDPSSSLIAQSIRAILLIDCFRLGFGIIEMKFQKLVASLERFGNALPVMLNGISNDDAKWKPENGNWSILEIVCHLIDEEQEDFGCRFRSTLHDPTAAWPAWDPEGCAVSREYNSRDLSEMIGEFVKARNDSVTWLKQLPEIDLTLAYEHPKLGSIPAGNVFASWVAHDLLHMRQFAKRMYELTMRDAEGFSVAYAGNW